jgi:hypothetical protein
MRFKVAFCVIAVLALTVAVFLFVREKKTPISAELLRCMRGKGTVVVQWEGKLDYKGVSGVHLLPIREVPEVANALTGQEADKLRQALDKAKTDAVLVSSHLNLPSSASGSLAARLSNYRYIPGFRALCLDPAGALYVADPLFQLSSTSEVALTTVARALLKGTAPPQVSSFPEPLRQSRTSEVMVTLLQGTIPRLWRSARGSSIARAMITAATVARSRWNEREQYMGGRLDERLPKMDIDVSLLLDDGTLLSREPVFINRAVSPVHGIGYEHKNTWQYLLPEDRVRKGKGSVAQAYQRLLEAERVASPDLQGSDLRLYRFVVSKLGHSPPQSSSQ